MASAESTRRRTRQEAWAAVPAQERQSASFEEYYREQLFKDDPAGFEKFLSALKTPAPMTLRVQQTQARVRRQLASEALRKFAGGLQPVEWVSGFVAADRHAENEPVAWECSHDEYHSRPDLEEWCRSAHSCGAVTFQESVSMLPAFLLQVRAHHRVVDLCAAPGSKTTLLLDLMHRNAEKSAKSAGKSRAKVGSLQETHDLSSLSHAGHATPESIPTTSTSGTTTSEEAAPAVPEGVFSQPLPNVFPSGMVVANDADAKRCRLLLAKRVRQVITPCAAVTVGNGQSAPLPEQFFDRVLADVPCSGDGVVRKDPSVWKSWRVGNALSLHTTQLRILKKALRLVKPGGVVAYSTCSFNPIENEAVVCSALVGAIVEGQMARKKLAANANDCIGNQGSDLEDEFEIISPAEMPAGIQFSRGLSDWRIPFMSTAGKWTGESHTPVSHLGTDSRLSAAAGTPEFEDNRWCHYQRDGQPATARLPPGIKRSMFPASGPFAHVNTQLQRCVRMMPHLYDGGGFFVALIRRRKVLPTAASPTKEELVAPTGAAPAGRAVLTSNGVEESSKHLPLKCVPKGLSSSRLIVRSEATNSTSGRGDRVEGGRAGGGCLFHSFDADTHDSIWNNISKFYGLKIPAVHDEHSLALEGKRVVLMSNSLLSFIKFTEKQATMTPHLRAVFNIVSAGLRLLLRMSPSTIRASKICRWRPTQEGAAYLATVATRRRLRFSRTALRNLIHCRKISVNALLDLAATGQVWGMEDLYFVVDESMDSESATQAAREGGDRQLHFEAGGVIVGLQPSRESQTSQHDWCWVACMLSSQELLVYANEVALWAILDELGGPGIADRNPSAHTVVADREAWSS